MNERTQVISYHDKNGELVATYPCTPEEYACKLNEKVSSGTWEIIDIGSHGAMLRRKENE